MRLAFPWQDDRYVRKVIVGSNMTVWTSQWVESVSNGPRIICPDYCAMTKGGGVIYTSWFIRLSVDFISMNADVISTVSRYRLNLGQLICVCLMRRAKVPLVEVSAF